MSQIKARDRERYDRMVKLLSWANSTEQLEELALLYIADPSYLRADIALAIKTVETKRRFWLRGKDTERA